MKKTFTYLLGGGTFCSIPLNAKQCESTNNVGQLDV